MTETENVKRCGYVAIIGAPNAGKSTLTNALVGTKVAIVTPKVQTTRNKVTGIAMEGAAQIIFLDTPGIFSATQKFEQAMVASAWSSLQDADVVLLLVDAKRKLSDDTKMIIERLKKAHKTVWLALNKVDSAEKPRLLTLSQELYDLYPFDKSFMISAQKGNGLLLLREKLAEAMPQGPWLYPDDQPTTMNMRDIAAEITREKIFLRLREELPYSAHVETEKWEEEENRLRIHQVIVLQRESHKKIILGDKGQMLKAIGTSARHDMEKQFGRKLHLALFVKVREGWKDDREIYTQLGLEY